jgi:hypothetical protein
MRESSVGRIVFFLAFALLVALAARADIIHLVDGRKLEGEVRLDGDTYVITGRSGIKTRIKKYMVLKIVKAAPPAERIAKAGKALVAKGKKATADEWAELGKLATELNLKKDARRAFAKAVSVDPNHKIARKALGQVSYGGRWIPKDEAMTRQGKVKVDGRWVDKKEAEDKRSGKAAADARKKIEKAKAKAKASIAEHVTCGNCQGSGMSVWIPCRQCEGSGKPGYSNLGDRYALCMRCKGAGRLPGIKCVQCRGRGKYDPKKKRTPRGRHIAKGFKLCEACSGTGVEAYLTCLQCARSKFPGFCFFGERYEICRKCYGAAKVPALFCAPCQRSGLVREKR